MINSGNGRFSRDNSTTGSIKNKITMDRNSSYHSPNFETLRSESEAGDTVSGAR